MWYLLVQQGLHKTLDNKRKKTASMTNQESKYLNVFNTLIFYLNSMDVKLDDKDKEITLLCSFPESWDHLVISINFSTTETLEFDYVVRDLLCEEVCRKSSLETSTLEALVARGWSTERG